MSIIKYIDEYVLASESRAPIFTDDLYEYVAKRVPGLKKDVLNAYISRYEKANPDFIRHQKGIYYKTVTTPFGKANINFTELIKKTYLANGAEVYGYETGPSLMNKLGLTTQMPSQTYIATERVRVRITGTEGQIHLMKPLADISNDNYRYLQLLDVLDNRMKIEIEAENYLEILRNYIDKHELNFELMLYYAGFYKNNRIYGKIAELARGGSQA